tara:strand:+ start:125 stop:547 length:423 start_codon:yes stop_codon:yes gene_type:complete
LKTSLLRDEQNPVEESALILTELSLIQGILLASHRHEVTTREGNAEKSEALIAQILLDPHRIRLVNLTLLDACSTGGADSRATGTGHGHFGLFSSGQHGLVVTALKMVTLAIKLKGDGINSRCGVAHLSWNTPNDGFCSA